jgi:hypothetical protein
MVARRRQNAALFAFLEWSPTTIRSRGYSFRPRLLDVLSPFAADITLLLDIRFLY